MVDLLTRRPAELLGLPAGTLAAGAAADICLFDPKEAWRYDAANGFSKSANSPWHGQILTGRVKTTITAPIPKSQAYRHRFARVIRAHDPITSAPPMALTAPPQ